MFLISMPPRPALESSRPTFFYGYRVLFPPRVKWQEREADHSPPSSAEEKNCGAANLLSSSSLHGVMPT
jgi:hypothetical protein